MTSDEIVFDIKERASLNSDDRAFNFPDRHLMFVYEESRATTISQQLNRSGRTIDTELYQTIVVPMEKANRSFCPLCPTDCKVLRSVDRVPNIMNTHNHPIVDRVGANDVLSKKYKFIEYSHVDTVFAGVFSYKYVYTFVLNGYLYAVSKNKLVNSIKTLIMRAVFDEPSKVLESNICSELAGGSCKEYPIKMKYHDFAIQMTLQKISPKLQVPLDKQNDSDAGLLSGFELEQSKQKPRQK